MTVSSLADEFFERQVTDKNYVTFFFPDFTEKKSWNLIFSLQRSPFVSFVFAEMLFIHFRSLKQLFDKAEVNIHKDNKIP